MVLAVVIGVEALGVVVDLEVAAAAEVLVVLEEGVLVVVELVGVGRENRLNKKTSKTNHLRGLLFRTMSINLPAKTDSDNQWVTPMFLSLFLHSTNDKDLIENPLYHLYRMHAHRQMVADPQRPRLVYH